MDSSLNQKLNPKEDEEEKNSTEDQRLLKLKSELEAKALFEEQIWEKAEDIDNLKRKLEYASSQKERDSLEQSIKQESDILERIKASYQEYLEKMKMGKESSMNDSKPKLSVEDGYWPLYKQDIEFKTEDE